MAIKEFVSLEGVDDVKKSLQDLQTAGEQSAKAFTNIGQGAAPSLSQINIALKQVGQSFAEGGSGLSGFSEALHVLRPALSEFGLGLVNVRELSILARVGLEGLATAIAVGIAVAAAKAADALANLQRSFQFLFGAQGANALDQLKKSADDLGTSVVNLAPALQSILAALERASSFKGFDPATGQTIRGLPQDTQKATDAIAALTKQLELLGQTGAEASKPVNEFFKAISAVDPKTGRAVGLTQQAFESLQKSAPEAAQAVKNALEQNLLGDLWARLQKGPIDLKKVIDALAATKPKLDIQPVPETVLGSIDRLKNSWTVLLETLGQKTPVGGVISELPGAITALTPLVLGVATNIATLGHTVVQFFADLGKLGTAIADAFRTGNFAPALTAIKTLVSDLVGNLISGLQTAFGDLPSRIIAALANIDWKGAFEGLINAGVATVGRLEQLILDGFNALITSIGSLSWESVWNGLYNAASGIFDRIKAAWQALVDFINSTRFQPPQPGVGGAPSVTEFASGGYVRGPGGSTSDNILAWLSNQEFVVNAAAVRHYGVGFMDAINAMQLPRSLLKGFSSGGLVLPPFPSPPRFAQGGFVTTGPSRSLTLVLDGRSFAMSGSRKVVDELERAADLHNLSRMGRAPGWVR
jgi:hypothetical protein